MSTDRVYLIQRKDGTLDARLEPPLYNIGEVAVLFISAERVREIAEKVSHKYSGSASIRCHSACPRCLLDALTGVRGTPR